MKRRMKWILVILLPALLVATLMVSAHAATEKMKTLDAVFGAAEGPDTKLTGAWRFDLFEKNRLAGDFALEIRALDGKDGTAYKVRMDTSHETVKGERQLVSIEGLLTAGFRLTNLTRRDRQYGTNGKLQSDETSRLELRGEDAFVLAGEGKQAVEVRIEKPGALTMAPAVVFALAKAMTKTDRDAGVVFRVLPLETLRLETLRLQPTRRALPLSDAGRTVLGLGDGTTNVLEFVADAKGNIVRFGPPGSGIEFRAAAK